jgi:Spy/CpxP family protein refolding chaperone
MSRLRIPLFALLFAAMPFVASAQKALPGSPSTSQPEPRAHAWHGSGEHGFMGMGSQARIDRSLNVLQEKLNLTDSQQSRVKQLVESRRSRFESIREESRPKFRQLMELLNKPNPDPTAVGQAAIALKQVHERAIAEQAKLENEFMGILNDTQRQIVNDAKRQAPTALALHSLGLLPREGRYEEQARLFEP